MGEWVLGAPRKRIKKERALRDKQKGRSPPEDGHQETDGVPSMHIYQKRHRTDVDGKENGRVAEEYRLGEGIRI